MKVLHVDCSDTHGGAARAAFRIHSALLSVGIDSRFAVLQKSSSDWRVWQPERWTRLRKKLAVRGEGLILNHFAKVLPKKPWSLAYFSTPALVDYINNTDCDIVQLHWINGSCLSVADIRRIQKPIIWTLHDAWPFTGGCHYFDSCLRYQEQCRDCPQLAGHTIDFANKQFHAKERSFRDLLLSIVSPSQWLANCARQSALFRNHPITVIPNTLDQQIYQPVQKSLARQLLHLPERRKIILFGADNATHDPRKGYDLLCRALQTLYRQSSHPESILLLVFGASAPRESEKFPFEVRYIGRLHDDYSLALLYQAADVFAAPSREDNLPNTIAEASSCGTACIGFAIGGIPDQIKHMETGYLARPFDTDDFAAGLQTCLEHSRAWGEQSRRVAEQLYAPQICAASYQQVYERLLPK